MITEDLNEIKTILKEVEEELAGLIKLETEIKVRA